MSKVAVIFVVVLMVYCAMAVPVPDQDFFSPGFGGFGGFGSAGGLGSFGNFGGLGNFGQLFSSIGGSSGSAVVSSSSSGQGTHTMMMAGNTRMEDGKPVSTVIFGKDGVFTTYTD